MPLAATESLPHQFVGDLGVGFAAAPLDDLPDEKTRQVCPSGPELRDRVGILFEDRGHKRDDS